MFKSRKTAIIISIVTLILIICGFGYLLIRVKTVPDIKCVQKDTQEGYEQEDMYITMPISKNWLDSGFHADQYEATLYNNTANNLKDWSVKIKLPVNSKINDSWNIIYEDNEDGTVTIYNDPEQGFNDFIGPNGGSITFGFILFSNEHISGKT